MTSSGPIGPAMNKGQERLYGVLVTIETCREGMESNDPDDPLERESRRDNWSSPDQ